MVNRDVLARLIGDCCVEGLRAEVSATPKPGLVDRANSGAHRDMDYTTFIASIAAIGGSFPAFARAGMELAALDEHTLSAIRPLGVQCEERMLAATGGVNTHKGAVFSLGILAAAAGYCAVQGQGLGADTLCAASATIARPALRDFERTSETAPTKGQELYRTQGVLGVRGEAASGFASVRQAALPQLRLLYGQREHPREQLHLQALLLLMSTVEDTNVMARCGASAVALMHREAQRILAVGGALTPQGLALLQELDGSFITQNISPGGCADLLTVTIALLRLEELETKGTVCN